jgi:N-acetylmuramoyl-L-alanine amidase
VTHGLGLRRTAPERRPAPMLPVALAAALALVTGCTPAGALAVAAPPPAVSSSSTPASPSTSPPTALVTAPGGGLQGKVIVIDPGHNGANGRHSRRITRRVWIGNGRKACDTTGTQTNAGYPESAFTFDVATRLAALLRARGATVVLTRADDRGVGPCITERAAIGNRAHADAAISIHADGAPSAGHGFHVIVPRGIGRNDAIVAPSRRLGATVRDAFRQGTGEPLATYTGRRTGGLVARSDLGGLNLSTVPKVFIECGNMRNPGDARRIRSATWRQRAAAALAAGLDTYLTDSPL